MLEMHANMRRGAKVIEESVFPAYRELLHYYQNEYYPNARDTLAAKDLPDGKAYYLSKIKEFTTLPLSPGGNPLILLMFPHRLQ